MPQILEQYGLTLGQPLLITYYLLLITYEQINHRGRTANLILYGYRTPSPWKTTFF